MKKRVAFFLFCCGAVISTFASALTHYRLDNGLSVLIKPDNRFPVVLTQMWYTVGSADERLGDTGVSHLLEHLLFEDKSKIASMGGYENAFTSKDATRYVMMLPASDLNLMLKEDAKRMKALSLRAQKLANEKKIVNEERRMRIENNPDARAYQSFNEVANIASPYQSPIIGYTWDLNHLTSNQIQNWHKRYYVPNNAHLVIVGDVNPDKVIAMVKADFNSILAKPLKARPQLPMFKTNATTKIQSMEKSRVPLYLVAFKVPSLNNVDQTQPYALSMLAGALGGLQSAMLEKSLVRDQGLAQGVSVSYSPIKRYAGLFTVMIRPMSGVTQPQIQTALWQVIDQVKSGQIPPDLFKRLKVTLKADFIYQQDSLSAQANLMGSIVNSALPVSLSESYLPHLLAVKPDQITQVANEFLTRKNMTTLWVDGGQG